MWINFDAFGCESKVHMIFVGGSHLKNRVILLYLSQ